jgi:predicted membrane protein (TIGR00267 family)
MPYIRNITRGLIDGSLSTLGIVLGAAISMDIKVIMAAGLGGGIANALSNILGALTAEKAAVMVDLGKYERAMVGSKTKLRETKIYEKEKRRIWASGVSDCIATLVGSLVSIAPFALLSLTPAIYASIGLTVGLLFVLGLYLGKLSKENMIFSGIKMAIFGVITAIVASSLQFFFS